MPTQEQYHAAVLALELIAERVRDLKRESDSYDKAAKHAIKLNGDAYAEMVEAVAVHRALANALVDGAGHQKAVTLEQALSMARQWIENGRPEPDGHRELPLDGEHQALEVEVLAPGDTLEP